MKCYGKKLPIVSIIIPLYNAQKYINECIQSILTQTFENWELILVDDGSTDDTLSICRSFEKKDCRIKVIHQENAGVSVARNTGIKAAEGNYLVFADGDDQLTADSLKCRVNLMEQADMGIAGYEIIGKDDVVEERMPSCGKLTLNKREAIKLTLLVHYKINN